MVSLAIFTYVKKILFRNESEEKEENQLSKELMKDTYGNVQTTLILKDGSEICIWLDSEVVELLLKCKDFSKVSTDLIEKTMR